MIEGQRIRISGAVEYGGTFYRVASEGTVEEVGDKQSLINIDMIDGDSYACVFVDNNIIYEIK